MYEDAIKKFLSRFKFEELSVLSEKWPPLSKCYDIDVSHEPKLRRRKAFISELLKFLRHEEVTRADVGELDLIYVETNWQSRIWNVFELEKIPGDPLTSATGPKQFQQRILKELLLYFDVDVAVHEQNEAYWIRIAVHDGKSKDVLPQAAYFVHPPKTNYLVAANLRAKYCDYILQMFLKVLKCHTVKEMHLRGRHLPSLLQLVANKHAKGALSRYHSAQPLTDSTNRKRQAEETEDLDCRVVYENLADKRQREQTVEQTFGHHTQPTLEKLEYKLETKFKGTAYAPAMKQTDEIFHCSVHFEGRNVLEGIKQLGNAGLAEMPMKTHISALPSLARNYFVLSQKSSSNTPK